jgi:chaperonin cofactor prefoldin
MTKKEHIQELRKIGKSYSEIAKAVGCSKTYVQKVLVPVPKTVSTSTVLSRKESIESRLIRMEKQINELELLVHALYQLDYVI